MTKNGKLEHVVIDNYIPTKNHEPCFSKANGNELWVILLEKAWAKVRGNYLNTEGGLVKNGLRLLTGAPVYTYAASSLQL